MDLQKDHASVIQGRKSSRTPQKSQFGESEKQTPIELKSTSHQFQLYRKGKKDVRHLSISSIGLKTCPPKFSINDPVDTLRLRSAVHQSGTVYRNEHGDYFEADSKPKGTSNKFKLGPPARAP